MNQSDDDRTMDLTINVDDRNVQDATDRMRRAASQFQSSIERAFNSAISGGRSFDQVLKQLALSISSLALKQALAPVTQGLTQALTGSFGNLTGSVLPFARGGVIDSGRVRPFAKGGVLSAPAFFPLAGGVGLAGEAGPEAILPLSRGPDGRLGVRSETGSKPLSVVMNVTTSDAASFRRSEAQVTAMLARAVGRGRRGL
ncbi:phage tail tape measure protein [Coralliovum pocilloporae]|uniref:phage tail tape measure protein n=1 Tax=Coralliovum pocilloporae TaxID=3066369 RepID=UPI0033076C31